jgi:hypothetical protein
LATLFPTFLVTFLATLFDSTLFYPTIFLAAALVTYLMITVFLFAIRVDSDGYSSELTTPSENYYFLNFL